MNHQDYARYAYITNPSKKNKKKQNSSKILTETLTTHLLRVLYTW